MKKSEAKMTEEKPVSPIKPKMMEDSSSSVDEYKLDDAVSTLQKAEEIRQDKDLMGKIKVKLGKKINSIDGLKKLYESKFNKPTYNDGKEEKSEGE